MPIRNYLSLLPDTTPRQWRQFLRRKFAGYQPLPAFDDEHPIVFVLSTGRVGTQTLAALLNLAPNLFAHHELFPKLYGLGRLAYWYSADPLARTILIEATSSARQKYWQYALNVGRGYAETSPQLTFLAPILFHLYPQARFIHLVRHPYAVIRSGMRRGWYQDHPADATRLIPKADDPLAGRWQSLPRIDKIAWLWAETNRWITTFMRDLPPQQRLTLQAESLFAAEPSTLESLYPFVSSPLPPPRKIQRILGRQLNAQKTGHFPPPQEWDERMRQDVWHWVGDIAESLGYAP